MVTDSAALPSLPSSIIHAIKTLRWPLNRESSSPMLLEPLERLAEIRSPRLQTGEDTLSTVALLRRSSSAVNNVTCSDGDDHLKESWARIATALILLGHGYVDEAHDLVGPLSFPKSLPYFNGPPVSPTPDVLAAASVAHCLVHRREGPHVSEFGMTGFENSNFWAGSALRCGGEDTLPLAETRGQVAQLAHGNPAAQEWLQEAMNHVFNDCEWHPRPLTELCATVLVHAPESGLGSRHVLQEFAEHAALVELRVLLRHALIKLGYDTTSLFEDERASSNVSVVEDPASSHLLPHTFNQALNLHDHAVVVTTAASPHRIVHVNQAWSDMCGYTCQQAECRTFSIIQGPETNTAEAAAMVRRCHETLKPQEAYLVNYTATGERFINHVTIGPLKHSQGSLQAQYFVGILEKVDRVPCTPAA